MVFDVTEAEVALHAQEPPNLSRFVVVIDTHLRLAAVPELGIADFTAPGGPDQMFIKLGSG